MPEPEAPPAWKPPQTCFCPGCAAACEGDPNLKAPPGNDIPQSCLGENGELLLEEQTTHRYQVARRTNSWYHVAIGEVLGGRYRICLKLGWGWMATTWMAEDLHAGPQDDRYVCVKVNANRDDQPVGELEVMRHCGAIASGSAHPGKNGLCLVLKSFNIFDEEGHAYLCLVMPVLSSNFNEYTKQLPQAWLDIEWVRTQLYQLLEVVDFLHRECSIVHGDIHGANICLAVNDYSILASLDRAEETSPSPRKIMPDGRVIHTSHPINLPLGPHRPILIDFGGAQIREGHSSSPSLRDVKPHMAPAEMHGMRDIRWVGKMFLNLIQGKMLCYVHGGRQAARELAPESEVNELRGLLEDMEQCDRGRPGLTAHYLLEVASRTWPARSPTVVWKK